MSPLAVYRTIPEMRQAIAAARQAGQRIGLVPTMGALHAGHARLIEVALSECDFVVVSIFVNPTQFGPNEDFDRYPRSFAPDRELCARSGAAAIFAPDIATMYRASFRTFVEVEGLQDLLCGAARPGHFRGVCTVVLKLFNIVQPDVAYFGQKDAQQALILTRMVHDLDLPIEMRTVPTVREADGLALSSRNQYLDPAQRKNAPALWQTLHEAQRQIESGERDPNLIERMMMDRLSKVPGARVDYARVVSAETLQRLWRLQGQILIALAVFFGQTRLIDNVQMDVKD
ncbi:MAG TPA: pantoate--beta-alanine ligase [Gemmataceae bacterium]|nr:pantoate--beta-alanine ligase [Gemmataceae bacterium]